MMNKIKSYVNKFKIFTYCVPFQILLCTKQDMFMNFLALLWKIPLTKKSFQSKIFHVFHMLFFICFLWYISYQLQEIFLAYISKIRKKMWFKSLIPFKVQFVSKYFISLSLILNSYKIRAVFENFFKVRTILLRKILFSIKNKN